MTVTSPPEYVRPPVVETVLGVQFRPLPGFTNAHLGLLWKQLEPDWQNIEDAPSIEPKFEEFGMEDSWRNQGLQLKLTQDIGSRLWIRNESNDRMIQLQNGRLLYNWLGHKGDPYPTYDKIRPEFDALLDRFYTAVRENSLGKIQPNQWELTYVNQIPQGELWQAPSDWSTLFSSLPGPGSSPSGVPLESFGGEWHYEIEPKRGRLHLQIRHGRKASGEDSDDNEFLGMNLTARGPVNETVNTDDGLIIGHRAIIDTFNSVTSMKCQDYWRRIST